MHLTKLIALSLLGLGLGLALGPGLPLGARAAGADAQGLSVTDTPPPAAAPAPPSAPPLAPADGALLDMTDIFNAFSLAPMSPRNTAGDSVTPAETFELGVAFANGTLGHPKDQREAAYWLRRALMLMPDDTGARRAWAAGRLGTLLWLEPGDVAAHHRAARVLWLLAAAWGNGDALCNLGQITADGDDANGVKPDKAGAAIWYEKAARAGCADAPARLAQLRP
jgi:TPR repeat protein